MSKLSKKKSLKKKRHAKRKKRNKISTECHVYLPAYKRKKLRLVGYVSYFDAENFSGEVCNRKIDSKIIELEYSTLYGPDAVGDTQYVRIAVHTSLIQLSRAEQLLEDLFPGEVVNNFQSMTCRDSVVEISDENLRLIGIIAPDEVDQLKGDLKFSDSGNEVEIIFYKLVNDYKNIIVEIYVDDFMTEYIIHLLKKGWMSEKWGNKFYILGGATNVKSITKEGE